MACKVLLFLASLLSLLRPTFGAACTQPNQFRVLTSTDMTVTDCVGIKKFQYATGCGAARGGDDTYFFRLSKEACQMFAADRGETPVENRSWGNLGGTNTPVWSGETNSPFKPYGCLWVNVAGGNFYMWNRFKHGATPASGYTVPATAIRNYQVVCTDTQELSDFTIFPTGSDCYDTDSGVHTSFVTELTQYNVPVTAAVNTCKDYSEWLFTNGYFSCLGGSFQSPLWTSCCNMCLARRSCMRSSETYGQGSRCLDGSLAVVKGITTGQACCSFDNAGKNYRWVRSPFTDPSTWLHPQAPRLKRGGALDELPSPSPQPGSLPMPANDPNQGGLVPHAFTPNGAPQQISPNYPYGYPNANPYGAPQPQNGNNGDDGVIFAVIGLLLLTITLLLCLVGICVIAKRSKRKAMIDEEAGNV